MAGLRVNDGRFDKKQMLFAGDTVLVADTEKKLCRLASKFCRVCERRKLRVNVLKSTFTKCSRYVNVGRMLARINYVAVN